MKKKSCFMNEYRKYLEPEYGEMSFEVCIPASENIDLDNPKLWRDRHTPETVAAIHRVMKKCSCYEELMTVTTTDTYLERDGAFIPVRIYHPMGEGTFPVVVFYHGGAFMMNNFSVYDYVTRYLAMYGKAVVVVVEYRLAPEYRCPVGLEDAYAALLWTKEHAAEYGGDAASLSLCGDSSGGNFVAAVSILARNRKGPKIQKQIMVYPLLVFKPEKRHYSEERYGSGYFLEYNSQDEPFAAYFEEGKKEDMYNPEYAPLLEKDLTGLPPACFLAAECDPLLDQGLMYAARLEDAGVAVEYHMYKGMIHSFLNYAYGKTFECLDTICHAIPKLPH